MIAIVNVSEGFGVEYGRGLQHYEVRLNRIPLSEFTHNFKDGMIECLRKASESLVGVDIDEKISIYRASIDYYHSIEDVGDRLSRIVCSYKDKEVYK